MITLLDRISTKSQNYELYHSGFFGNKALTWNSYQEIIDSGWENSVCIRSAKGMQRTNVRYDVPLSEVRREIEALKQQGIQEENLVFNQSMPNDKLIIQGELMISTSGLYLHHSNIKKPMNLALAEKSHHSYGLEAKMLLDKNLFPSSLSDIQALLELFPDSIIEFSSYSIPVGNIPGRNTVIWEVRNY